MCLHIDAADTASDQILSVPMIVSLIVASGNKSAIAFHNPEIQVVKF